MNWEYQTYTWNSASLSREEDLTNDLNALGSKGWEVVSSTSTRFYCGDTGTEKTNEVVFLLKRQK
ncbi:MAG TPA: hypothetical protein VEZ91_11835 [Kurthia gibsonii]|uniref:hypothetical protein n=1 Tax=Kurthia gibsonii TaxID=33946 RepID=UPI002D4C23E1|nr:hypothetical protein [Kurthia gibsonii]